MRKAAPNLNDILGVDFRRSTKFIVDVNSITVTTGTVALFFPA